MPLPKINAPKYTMTIPSTQEKVVYRPYLVKEEKILMLAMEAKDNLQMIQSIKDVIESCTFDALKTDTLTMFDLEYIITQLRMKSVGEISEVRLLCPKCEAYTPVQINLADVKIVDLNTNDKKIIKLNNEISLKMKYPALKDMQKNAINNKEVNEDKVDVEGTFKMLSSCIDSIYTTDEVFDLSAYSEKEISEFFDSLSSSQFELIKDFMATMPRTSLDIEYDCSGCSEHIKTEISGLQNFFV